MLHEEDCFPFVIEISAMERNTSLSKPSHYLSFEVNKIANLCDGRVSIKRRRKRVR